MQLHIPSILQGLVVKRQIGGNRDHHADSERWAIMHDEWAFLSRIALRRNIDNHNEAQDQQREQYEIRLAHLLMKGIGAPVD